MCLCRMCVGSWWWGWGWFGCIWMKQGRKCWIRWHWDSSIMSLQASPLGTWLVDFGDLAFLFLWHAVWAVLCSESEIQKQSSSIISLGTRQREKEGGRKEKRQVVGVGGCCCLWRQRLERLDGVRRKGEQEAAGRISEQSPNHHERAKPKFPLGDVTAQKTSTCVPLQLEMPVPICPTGSMLSLSVVSDTLDCTSSGSSVHGIF